MEKVGVVIGRLQGFTKAHQHLIYRAALDSDRVIVLVGSANRRKSAKNPWTFEERVDAIKFCLHDWEGLSKLTFVPIDDIPNNDDWKWNVVEKVWDVIDEVPNTIDNVDITIFGCDKDESTFYLEMFPEWKLELLDAFEGMDATNIRKKWLDGKQTLSFLLDDRVMHPRLGGWLYAQPYNPNLQDEFEFYRKEKEKFANYPYPETLNFLCADAVVVYKESVLMIKRKFAPGKDCWATPGGFKNANESLQQAAIRELIEETGINFTPEQLENCIINHKIFDDPKRSLGIPRITMGVLFDFSWLDERPIIKPADDAVDYRWFAFNELKKIEREIYDDHQRIIEELI